MLEGTPDHPGPAIPPGSPCSYTPANPGGNVTVGDEGLPRPWNPLPCAGAAIGPFGGPVFPAPIDVADVAAEPERSAPDAGHADRRAAG